ncbi:MAG: tRNA pseudouridine(55) synthase TruB [Candidatus Azotimanducaceae bacterium WSBS_2022_MAG_OTU7]
MGRRGRKGRNINGILLLDKPPGITSNAALQIVKRLFDAAKAGHTGSLDPLATGVLPLCFGEATKFSQFLLDADKRYRATFKLGIITDSGDADGKVLETRSVPEIGDSKLKSVLENYRGEISQIPSMFSALKVNGQPLYKLARQGIEIERKSRQVTIHELRVLEQRQDEIEVEVHCTKGTYVRTLAEDIGLELGCGAHVVELRRLAAGPYKVDETVTMEQLEAMSEDKAQLDARLHPVSSAVQDWPQVELTDVTASYIRQGQPVQIANAPTTGWVSIYAESNDANEEFLGVGEIMDDGRIAPRRLVVTN